MIKSPVGLNGIDPSDPSLIQHPGSALADWALGSSPIAGDAASPDSPSTAPDLIGSGSADSGLIDLAEEAASIAGPGSAQTIGTAPSQGPDATVDPAAQLSGPVVGGDLAAGSADITPSGVGSSAVVPSAGSGGANTDTVSVAGSGLVFNNTFEASVTPAYESNIITAEKTLATLWTNPVTLNLDFQGQAEGITGQLASNNFPLVAVTYAQLTSALSSHAFSPFAQAAAASLPATDPAGGNNWFLPLAYARMLGLNSSAPAIDDIVTLNTSYSWSFGQDVVNTVEHEISEGGLGRIGGLGDLTTSAGNPVFSTMDLFRYSAVGVRDFSDGRDGKTTFFSFNGTELSAAANLSFYNIFNGSTKGPIADTADFTQQDIFGSGSPGETNILSQTDLKVMDVLGWDPSGSAPPPPLPPPPPPPPLLSPPTSPPPASILPPSPFPSLLLPALLPPLLLPPPLSPLLSPPKVITLGAGPQTVVGGAEDTIIGGSGPDVINGLAGSASIIGGGGATTIYGGVGDIIAAGSGNTYIDGTLGGMVIALGSGGTDIIIGSTAAAGGADTLTGGAAAAQIQSLGKGDVVNFAGQTGAAAINAMAGNIRMTLGSGPATIYGGVGDTIVAGSGNTYVDGTLGGMTIAVGGAGTDTIIGSTARAPGAGVDTLIGGAAAVAIQGLGKGDVVNFAGQTGAAAINATAGNIRVTLGGGPATVYGGLGDLVNLGSAGQYADGTAGGQAIAAGSGGTDIIIGSISAAGSGVDTLVGGAAAVAIQGLGKGDVVNFAGQSGAATINATAGNIRVSLGGGPATVYGGLGDTVNFGSVSQYADGTAGGQAIAVGSGGTDLVIGSMVSGAGDTLGGGAAALNYNAGAGGDLVNLGGSTGAATVNAVGADNGPVNDTVVASNGGDSVWGGAGDRIGVGAGASGTDLFTHATTLPGAAIGFGTNDAAAAVTYGSTPGAVTVNNAVPGVSTAQVSVGGFAETAGIPTDFVFYPGETSATGAAIVATSTQIIVNGAASTQFTLPDGTRMTLLGVPQADFNTAFFKP